MESVRKANTPKKYRTSTSFNLGSHNQTAVLEDYIEPVDQDQMQQDLADLMSIIKRAKEIHEESTNFSQDSYLRVNKIRYFKKKLIETKETNINIRHDNRRLKRKLHKLVDIISNPKPKTKTPSKMTVKSRDETRRRFQDLRSKEESDNTVIVSLKALNKTAQSEISILAAEILQDDFNYDINR